MKLYFLANFFMGTHCKSSIFVEVQLQQKHTKKSFNFFKSKDHKMVIFVKRASILLVIQWTLEKKKSEIIYYKKLYLNPSNMQNRFWAGQRINTNFLSFSSVLGFLRKEVILFCTRCKCIKTALMLIYLWKAAFKK